jgi:hypothetical protein
MCVVSVVVGEVNYGFVSSPQQLIKCVAGAAAVLVPLMPYITFRGLMIAVFETGIKTLATLLLGCPGPALFGLFHVNCELVLTIHGR